MKTVIYADILVSINIIVNYFLLRATSAITGNQYKISRFLLASGAGGIFSLTLFIENIPTAINIILKSVMLIALVSIAFGFISLKSFLKCCGAFFLANFAFAGIMLALSITVMPDAAIYRNGIAYFDINIVTLTVSAFICYAILNIISKFTKSKIPQKSIYQIKINYNGKAVEGKALFDSGNSLSDCFSGKPAIIAEKEFIKHLCNKTELTDLKNFRLIPFSTINGSGALPAFMAESTEILINGKWIEAKDIYIAITDKKIVSGGYSVLIGTPLFDAIENIIKGGNSKNEFEISTKNKEHNIKNKIKNF